MSKTEEIRRRDRKRWTLFAVGLLIPLFLIAMLFFAATQDAKQKKQYDAERAGYAQKYAEQEAANKRLASDPEATTSTSRKQ